MMNLKKITSILLLLFLVVLGNSCLKDDELSLAFDTLEPIDLNDGLVLSNPDAEDMDEGQLIDIFENLYADENLWSMRSLLVFRNGKLVAESYLKDKEDILNRHIIWSYTKQVMGVLTGIAIDQGVLGSIDDPISDYFDIELTDHMDKQDITLRNLLTMQSGIDYSNEKETDAILQNTPENSIELILNRPIRFPQGTEFHYNDGNPHLLSGIIQKVVGRPADVWADEVFFSKIEMINYNWLRYKDGVSLGGFGIETTPRELAKIALCVANKGQWKGEQVIDSMWVEEMTTSQVEINNSNYGFGFFWWVDETRGIYFMWGVGGQFAFVVPDKDMVVVMTSFPNTKGEYEIQSDEALAVVDEILGTLR
ncbi:MAG: serine hydrolase [Saprospiraceae bacterium]|nr:serine hydrolase [Saprospiraceae bacterium]